MKLEQWILISEILASILSITGIISFIFLILRWLWRKIQSIYNAKLSRNESDCIMQFEELDSCLIWEEDLMRNQLRIYEGLVKKGYLQELFSSPSRAMVSFGLSEKGKDSYKKLLFSSNPKLLKLIQSTKVITLEKISLLASVPESEVRKMIILMEDEGQLLPRKSDNRGTLFWVHKK